jgi:hypothetical protein
MNSLTMSGASSSRCSPTSRAAYRGWMTDASSMASFGSCDQVRHGAICRRASDPYNLLQSHPSLAAGWQASGPDHEWPGDCSDAAARYCRGRRRAGCGRLREKSCPWVNFSWSMETVGEPYGFYPKLLKWKHFVPSVPKSLGQQALRKIRSLEHFPAVCPPTRSTAASLKHRRCGAFPARHLGLRIVAIEEIGGPKATTEKQPKTNLPISVASQPIGTFSSKLPGCRTTGAGPIATGRQRGIGLARYRRVRARRRPEDRSAGDRPTR